MAMRKAAGAAKKADGFPAEAGHSFNEVPEKTLKKLSEETSKAFGSEEWELLDGINFPYNRCA